VNGRLENIAPRIWQEFLSPHGFCPQQAVQSGFSGSNVWKCVDEKGQFACLKRWTHPHPTRTRLGEIHSRLQQLGRYGLHFTPKLYCNGWGETIVEAGERLWELTTWLPGAADYVDRPSRRRLLSAIEGLARLHAIWSQDGRSSVSPTVQDRLRRLEVGVGLLERQFELVQKCRTDRECRMVVATCDAVRSSAARLSAALKQQQSLCICCHFVLRDIWSEHLLFDGERLTGIIDFGSARLDDPLTDLVRMLSTCEPSRPDEIRWGWEQYVAARQASGGLLEAGWSWERFELFDCVATLLSAVQWMQWLMIDELEFDAPREQLVSRWEGFVTRYVQSWVV
jgi:thiamine kinase-like enzyme